MSDPNEILTFFCDDAPEWTDRDGVTHQHSIIGCGATFQYLRREVDVDFDGDGAADCPECGMFLFVGGPGPL